MSQEQKYGYTCIKSKDKIAEWLDLSRSTVFTIIDTLVKKGYIEKNEIGLKPTSFIYQLDMCQEDIGLWLKSGEVELVTKKIQDILTPCTDRPETGLSQSRNCTQVYNRDINIKKEIYKEKDPLPLFPTNNGNEKQDEHSRGGGGPAAERFHKPTMEEVAEYVSSKYPSASKQSVESFAERFWSHYENKDWKYGRGIKMKNWKLALPQWKDTIEKELTSQTTVLSGKLNATISANNNLKFNIK
jgi:DNA-binding Lrp family transcriptional regulator